MSADRAALIAFCEDQAKRLERMAQYDPDYNNGAEIYRQIVAALGAAPWQEISSAPDDTPVLVVAYGSYQPWIAVKKDNAWWPDDAEGYYPEPTHWAALPAAPEPT